MKIQIIYYELKQKEFRSEKTLFKFLNTKLDSEILRIVQTKNKTEYIICIRTFLDKYKYRE